MSRLGDLHLDLLARGALQRGETLLATVVATSRQSWLWRRTWVLLATPWRLVLLEHGGSGEVRTLIALPWGDVDVVTLDSGKLDLRTRAIARTWTVEDTDSARRLVDAFDASRVRPPLHLVDPDRTIAFRRSGPSLEGTWRLLAVEGRSNGRLASLPFGRHPVGQLIYLRDGRMSVMLMAGGRARFGSHGIGAGTIPEKAAAFDSFLAYSGRYERLENRVIHYPDVASIPDFVGVPEERFVELEGDRLVLSTPPMREAGQGDQLRTFVIVWQRAAACAGVGRDASSALPLGRDRERTAQYAVA